MSIESPRAPSETREPSDRLLGRVARGTLVACLLLTVGGALLSGPRVALGVLGGGLISWLSLWTTRSGVGGLMAAGTARRSAGRRLLGLVGRYALLGLLAYVMIARLRLHPIGLLLGASSVVLAASAETIRLLVRGSAH